MISYYRYWQALSKAQESLKTVIAMQPDVPPMVEAQHEMDMLAVKFWRKKSEIFTKIFLIFISIVVIMVTTYVRLYIHD